MKKKSIVFIVVALLLALALIIGGISAYFTSTPEAKTNVFTIGNVQITLTEPTWDALPDANNNGKKDAAENLVPGQEVAKDPTVTNVGASPAYIFVKVEIPNYTGTSAATDLFDLHTVDTTKWNRIVDTTTSNVHTQVFAYATGTTKETLTPLAAGSNVKLFENVTLTTDETCITNAGTGDKNVVVTAYGIQTEGLSETTQEAIYELFTNP